MVDYPDQKAFKRFTIGHYKSESPSLKKSNRLYKEFKDYEGETKFKQFQK
jgi:hypothetical protein